MNMDTHSFNIDLACKYGIEEAILLRNLGYWLFRNLKNKKNIINGSVWTYNSAKAFADMFPYMNIKKIQRTLTKLEEMNVIKSDNFNQLGFDKTKWYTIVDPKLKERFGIDDFGNSIGQNDQSENLENTGSKASKIRLDKMTNQENSIGQNDQSIGQSDLTIPDIIPYNNIYILSDDKSDDKKTNKKVNWETVYKNTNNQYDSIMNKFNDIWELYGKVGSKKMAFKQWYKLTDKEKEKAYNNIPNYFASLSDLKYRKHMERYISQEIYLQEFTTPKKTNNTSTPSNSKWKFY